MDTIPVFTEDNSQGYTTEEREALNAEFTRRWSQIEWQGATLEEAKQWFAEEVSHR